MTHRLTASSLFVLLVALTACNSRGSSTANPSANPATPPVAERGATALEQPPRDPREALLAQGVGMMLATEHLQPRAVDDEVSRKAFATYLERLDPGKLFLLAEHVAELQVYADRMDDQLRDGDLALARAGAARLAQRQKVVAELVAARLAEPFDFSREEDFETDPEKRQFAATEKELAERWRKALKLQVLERIHRMERVAEARAKGKTPGAADADGTAPDETELDAADLARAKDLPATFEEREAKARDELANSWSGRMARLARVEPLEPAERFLNAITTVYDPHTVYLAPADKKNFDIQMSGTLEGIGASLSEDAHYIVVRELIPGGASWREGSLEPGDLILAVTQEGAEPVDVIDMRINEVVEMIRGPKGTVVTLTVRKPDDRIEIISITRDVVEIEAAYARGALLDLGPKRPAMGYISLPSFYGNTRAQRGATGERNATDDVRALLEELSRRKVGGVILDLRGNGGGLLDHARDVAGLFIETGPVVQTRHAGGGSQVLVDEDPRVAFRGEVIVLVDRFSASASEIVAGALQDYRRALIVGTGPTHGKGTVQVLLDLDRLRAGPGEPLGVLKLTIQQFFRVSGGSIQWRGVVPDIALPDPAAHVESGERYLDNAIPWTEVDALAYTPWPKASWDLATLTARSEARRTKRPVFTRIEARTAYLLGRRDDTRVPLARERWLAERERDRSAIEALTTDLDESEPRFGVTMIGRREAAKKPEAAAGDAAARERGRVDPVERWRDQLSRDPWVEEAVHVLVDMTTAR